MLGTMDLQGLQGGDYMQLLNFFPLHKMKICLRWVHVVTVSLTRSLNEWYVVAHTHAHTHTHTWSVVKCTRMTNCTASSCCLLHPLPPSPSIPHPSPHRDFKAMGVTGTGPVLMRALESWVTDIYSNQMHQVPYPAHWIFSFIFGQSWHIILLCSISLSTYVLFFLFNSIPPHHLMVVSSLIWKESVFHRQSSFCPISLSFPFFSSFFPFLLLLPSFLFS